MANTAPSHSRGESRSSDASCGVITVAFGSPRYIRLAKILAWSLELHCPQLPRAIVTDSGDSELAKLYDICLPYRTEWGRGFDYKFFLNDYSPFDRTLYIDCDCLVVRELSHVWQVFADVPFGVEGRQVSDGVFEGDVATICRRLGVKSIPRFNGGMYYFDRSDAAMAVFGTAREVMARYQEFGLNPMARGFASDEPVIAISLAMHGIEAVDDGGSTMRTPIGIRGPMHIDVLRGYCEFNKEGVEVSPAIAHFADWRSRGFHYNREAMKLALARRVPVPHPRISSVVNGVCDPLYGIAQVGRPLLPVMRNVYRRWAYR
jgi:hypothetical protein